LNIRELDIREWKEWLSSLNRLRLDIYVFPEYYQANQEHEGARPVGLGIDTGNCRFIYPFFIKPIDGYDLGDEYFDIFTAYGYGGLLSSETKVDKKTLVKVNRLIDEWCVEHRVITEFIRENRVPEYIGSYLRDAEHHQVRVNVTADLTGDLSTEISKSRKRFLRIASRAGLHTAIDEKGEYLEEFFHLYNLTMNKVKASGYYYFDLAYFQNLFAGLRNKVELILAWDGDMIAAGAICFRSGSRYVYHLGASDPEKLSKKPNDLLFFSMMERGKSLGYKSLLLGGGTGNDPDDSLFHFKLKFGSRKDPCHIGRKIHFPEIYGKLCREWEKRYPELVKDYGKILQKYRIHHDV